MFPFLPLGQSKFWDSAKRIEFVWAATHTHAHTHTVISVVRRVKLLSDCVLNHLVGFHLTNSAARQ